MKSPSNPLIAVAYLRVSTDDQKLGPQAQRAQIEAWSAHAGVTVASWHTDEDVSGASELGARPGLVAALGAIKANGAGLLVVAKRDRLARDVGVVCAIDRAVAKLGASIVSADGTGNGEGAAAEFMRTIIDGAAQYERALIRERTKAALGVKRAKGERIGCIPFGYELGADGVRLQVCSAEVRVIARARDLREGGASLRTVVATLAAEGLHGRRGPLGVTQVVRLLG